VPADTTTPPATPGQDRRPLARRLLRWETALVVLLVVVGLVGEQTSPGFLTGSNLFYLGLDVGEIALLSVLVAGALAGALNGFLVTRLGLPSLAVTIGTLAMYRGLAFVILGDEAVADFPSSYTRYGTTPIPGTSIPYPIALFAVLAVVFGVVLHATPFGRSVFAIGANQEAAFFSGIRVRRTKFILFALSGAMAGLGGIVFTLRFASARADNGAGLELAVVAAVLLGGVSIFGGKGTLGGVVAAVFLLGGVRSALILNDVSNDILNVVTGLLLIASVIAPNASAAIGRAVGRRRAATPATPT